MRSSDRRPIGVFDSGVGGLTVLKALMERLPHERTRYLGDTARVPYGTKSAEVVTRYAVQNAKFLAEHDIKLLVIACNTASAFALPALREKLGIPVIGVIEPGARAAAKESRTGRIGVIGTPGTIASGSYQRALEAARPGVQVIARACPLFVPLAEEGWVKGEVPALVAREYLTPFAGQVDALVLGCTHYPLLSEVIAGAVGPGVALVDSAHATADAVVETLTELDAFAPADSAVEHAYYVTDVPHRFSEVGARFLGRAIDQAEQVDIRFD